MTRPQSATVAAAFEQIERLLKANPDRLSVLGVCGSQGSGKTTLARELMGLCAERGIIAATLSLDDLYLSHAARQRLAREVYPLLATRGVPGTHDVELGIRILDALERGEPERLPRFSKANDDRLPPAEWQAAPVGCRVLLFEGWCVGARPQTAEALRDPVNDLETREDPRGIWRHFVNDALAGAYQRLFARIDALVLLAAPSFEVVLNWRIQQEDELRANVGADAPGLMSPEQIARFISHYERLTRHILAEMPQRADLVIRLADDRAPRLIERLA